MSYLMRINVRPDESALTERERRQLEREFDTYAGEVRIHGQPVGWDEITEIELVTAPTTGGIAAAVLGFFVDTTDRFHLGIYLGRDEAVLANITKKQALYAIQAIAYYAPNPVRFIGPDGLVPLVDL